MLRCKSNSTYLAYYKSIGNTPMLLYHFIQFLQAGHHTFTSTFFPTGSVTVPVLTKWVLVLLP